MANPPTDENIDGEVAKLVIRNGVQPKKIAARLRVSEQSVRVSLKRIRRTWLKRIDQSFDRLIAEEVARLDEVERAAWEGWDRSLRDESSQTSKEVRGSSSDSDKNEFTVKRTTKAGQPAFLSTIAAAVKQRSELLGLVDSEARNQARSGDDSPLVPIVVESREEAEQIKTLSLKDYMRRSAQDPPDEPAGATG